MAKPFNRWDPSANVDLHVKPADGPLIVSGGADPNWPLLVKPWISPVLYYDSAVGYLDTLQFTPGTDPQDGAQVSGYQYMPNDLTFFGADPADGEPQPLDSSDSVLGFSWPFFTLGYRLVLRGWIGTVQAGSLNVDMQTRWGDAAMRIPADTRGAWTGASVAVLNLNNSLADHFLYSLHGKRLGDANWEHRGAHIDAPITGPAATETVLGPWDGINSGRTRVLVTGGMTTWTLMLQHWDPSIPGWVDIHVVTQDIRNHATPGYEELFGLLGFLFHGATKVRPAIIPALAPRQDTYFRHVEVSQFEPWILDVATWTISEFLATVEWLTGPLLPLLVDGDMEATGPDVIIDGAMEVTGPDVIVDGAMEVTGPDVIVDGAMEAVGVAAWTAINAVLTKQGSPHSGTQCLRAAQTIIATSAIATQTILTIGKTYRTKGWARSDGILQPQVRDGGTTLWTGTTSTSWQPFDVVWVAAHADLQLRSKTGAGGIGDYVEFDDITVIDETVACAAYTPLLNALLSKQENAHGGAQCLRVEHGGTDHAISYQAILTVGKTYRIKGWARGDGIAKPQIKDASIGFTWTGTASTSWQEFDIVDVATATSLYLRMLGTSGYAEFDDVEVIDETVACAAWPVLNGALLSKQEDAYEAAQCLRIEYDGVINPGTRQIILTIANTYRVKGVARGDGTAYPVIRDGAGGFIWIGTTSISWQPFDFVYVTTATDIRLYGLMSAAGYVEFDDVEVIDNTAACSDWTAGNSASLSKRGSAHGGAQCLRIARNGVNDPYAAQTFLTIGQTYRIVGWARGDGATGVPRFRDSSGASLWIGTNSTSWQEFDFTFIAGGTALWLYSNASSGTDFVEFDDMTATSLSEDLQMPASDFIQHPLGTTFAPEQLREYDDDGGWGMRFRGYTVLAIVGYEDRRLMTVTLPGTGPGIPTCLADNDGPYGADLPWAYVGRYKLDGMASWGKECCLVSFGNIYRPNPSATQNGIGLLWRPANDGELVLRWYDGTTTWQEVVVPFRHDEYESKMTDIGFAWTGANPGDTGLSSYQLRIVVDGVTLISLDLSAGMLGINGSFRSTLGTGNPAQMQTFKGLWFGGSTFIEAASNSDFKAAFDEPGDEFSNPSFEIADPSNRPGEADDWTWGSYQQAGGWAEFNAYDATLEEWRTATEQFAAGFYFPYDLKYDTEAARLAATGFTASDVGKSAWQREDNTVWILTDDSPITWVQSTSGTNEGWASVLEDLDLIAAEFNAGVSAHSGNVEKFALWEFAGIGIAPPWRDDWQFIAPWQDTLGPGGGPTGWTGWANDVLATNLYPLTKEQFGEDWGNDPFSTVSGEAWHPVIAPDGVLRGTPITFPLTIVPDRSHMIVLITKLFAYNLTVTTGEYADIASLVAELNTKWIAAVGGSTGLEFNSWIDGDNVGLTFGWNKTDVVTTETIFGVLKSSRYNDVRADVGLVGIGPNGLRNDIEVPQPTLTTAPAGMVATDRLLIDGWSQIVFDVVAEPKLAINMPIAYGLIPAVFDTTVPDDTWFEQFTLDGWVSGGARWKTHYEPGDLTAAVFEGSVTMEQFVNSEWLDELWT